MKSQIFKNAWKLSKGTGMSFSNALKTAWDAFKNEVEIFISTSFNGMRIANYKKANCTSGSIKRVLEMAANFIQPKLSGAEAYYGKGLYNGD